MATIIGIERSDLAIEELEQEAHEYHNTSIDRNYECFLVTGIKGSRRALPEVNYGMCMLIISSILHEIK